VGEVGLYISPTVGMLPAPGTVYPFSMQARAADNGSLAQSASQSFTVPAISFNQVTASPAAVDSTPGGSATFDVSVANVGNVRGTFPLTVTTPISDWTAAITSPLTLDPGQSVTQTVTLQTPDGVVGQDYAVQIESPAGSYTQTATVDVHLASVAAVAADGAARSAASLFPANLTLASGLRYLGQAVETLQANCAGAALAAPGQGACSTDLRDRLVYGIQAVAASAAAQYASITAATALQQTARALAADTSIPSWRYSIRGALPLSSPWSSTYPTVPRLSGRCACPAPRAPRCA